ncbi:unnamed protein product, partial [Polarella glacialis]
ATGRKMDELEPNADGCTQFDPNPFKKEKCKHCGRLWNEHKGVISEALLQGYLKAKEKAVEDKEKKEAEAKQQAAAKKAASKRASQTPEDDWFCDGPKDEANKVIDDESDDDMGFRMFSAEELRAAPMDKPASSEPFKPLKVVNLIDFGECDVYEEAPPDNFGSGSTAPGSSSSTAPGRPPPEAPSFSRGLSRGVLGDDMPGLPDTPLAASGTSAPSSGPTAQAHQDLLEEIQHLRQMLADANEEKSIQVAIIRDEVSEKQAFIEELTRHRADAEAALRDARCQVEALTAPSAAAREEEQQADARGLGGEAC